MNRLQICLNETQFLNYFIKEIDQNELISNKNNKIN